MPLRTVIALSIMLLLWIGAWVMWTRAGTEHRQMKATIDAIAPDGNVESYDAMFHARVQRNMRWAAWVMALFGSMVIPVQRLFSSRRSRQKKGPTTLRQDLQQAFRKYNKRTSAMHKRMVLLVITIGAILRAFLLNEPIIYDEAFTYTYYVTRPFWVILSDYSYPNNHIFHTLLVKISTGLFGVDLVPLRLPAFIAGVLTMPLIYIFTRVMFNRYIAFTALCLVASMGGLVEYSAMARGYSITWVCFLSCLLLGRHFAKYNTSSSALLMGVSAAIGMWSVPTMIYAAAAVYIWLILHLVNKYRSTLNQRVYKLVYSIITAVFLTFIFYSPVIIVHGIDQLFYHPTMGEANWSGLMATHQDSLASIWSYWEETSSSWGIFLLFIAVLYASFISSKYRMLIGAMLMGSLPLILMQALLAPPRAWNYMQFILIVGASIALFYLLKFIQDKVLSSFNKRLRTIVSGLVLLLIFGSISMKVLPERGGRQNDARVAAEWLRLNVSDEDRVVVMFPWEAPIEFYMRSIGVDTQMLYRPPDPAGELFITVAPTDGQVIESVLQRHHMDRTNMGSMEQVFDMGQLEIYRTRPEL